MTELTRRKKTTGIIFALSAALFYGICAPLAKILLNHLSPIMLVALLYLGAGFGMSIIQYINKKKQIITTEAKLSKKDFPYILCTIVLDTISPILMMIGLRTANASSASLLNNFEIVITSLVAFVVFKEAIGKRMWYAIILVTVSSFILSFEDLASFKISFGLILVVLATVGWGFENNCTAKLSGKNPLQIVMIKGLGSGFSALTLSLILNQYQTTFLYLILAMILGFFAYGLSIFTYIYAQRYLGAARTSAFYSLAPFIGVIFSWIFLRERLTISFFIGLFLMIIATLLVITEKHRHFHFHPAITHTHKHSHPDIHHRHFHEDNFKGEHSHEHTHEELSHTHEHTPDLHHKHKH